ncbi:hypothetical protein [Hyalangium sp.]|uniref:hypothetical protein n=1 Tax=Hyalangium sp. TaxID=2028555 RepID=UPI002D68FB7D|nr:hypothetical protein [Hyalangium sp.]HYH98636.1 hypothetical protein [Hyalangium sp.]
MVTSTVLKRARVLGVAALLMAGAGCHDFDEAFAGCVDAGDCFPDDAGRPDAGTPDGGPTGNDGGGTPDSGTPDSGTPDSGPVDTTDGGPDIPDGGTDIPDSGIPDSGIPDSGIPDSGIPDSGIPDSGIPDSGIPDTCDGGVFTRGACPIGDVDAGVIPEGLQINECANGLCLRHQYTVDGPYELQGLWGSSPDDVFLAARARSEAGVAAQVVRFSNGRFSATTVDLPGFQPFRLQGTDSTNVWAINEAPSSGPCNPLLPCPSPVFRFDGQSWAPVGFVTNGRAAIQPPALYTGTDSTWVASSGGGVLRWTGGAWAQESTTSGLGEQFQALWGDTSAPRIGVGSDSHQLAAFGLRHSLGTWTPSSSMGLGPLTAIAGPSEKHLYAATNLDVLRWIPGDWWQFEATVPELDGHSPAVQDLWVSQDGSDVWVTLGTSYVLRKHQGEWSVVHLPVPPGFAALQIEGFDTPAGDLWITGTQSGGVLFRTSAYHFERQQP